MSLQGSVVLGLPAERGSYHSCSWSCQRTHAGMLQRHKHAMHGLHRRSRSSTRHSRLAQAAAPHRDSVPGLPRPLEVAVEGAAPAWHVCICPQPVQGLAAVYHLVRACCGAAAAAGHGVDQLLLKQRLPQLLRCGPAACLLRAGCCCEAVQQLCPSEHLLQLWPEQPEGGSRGQRLAVR